MPKALAIFCSDIHLSDRPPSARLDEDDWYGCMQRQMIELSRLKADLGVPILCGGDVFDRWNSPPRLINHALEHLPSMYSVPGQHDLPYHSYNDVRSSAYWTLVSAGKIVDLSNDSLILGHMSSGLDVYGVPWEGNIPKLESNDLLSIAVIHGYCWSGSKKHPEAKPDSSLISWAKKLKGFNIAVFGDNHKGFCQKWQGLTVVNCGAFYRRRADEIDYKPRVYILHENMSVKPYYLDVGEDVFIRSVDVDVLDSTRKDYSDLISELNEIDTESVDFKSYVRDFVKVKNLDEDVVKVINSILED